MGAYNRTNGEPCCASDELIGRILRGEWGFQGHYVSDCWPIRDIHENHGLTKNGVESSAMALNAGCDLNCGCTYLCLKEAMADFIILNLLWVVCSLPVFTIGASMRDDAGD